MLAAYIIIYGAFLLKTDGYPYVLDNNESYSCWWHARSLYENGVSHTKGLTDEVFSTQPAASPYVHTHQGNLPRLYTFALYTLGFRSIAAQIWITTFTVGLAGIYFAFRFLSGLANQRFAALACLVMMTNYLLFAQWQVSLYNVWHVFFFFSSLLCVRALGRPDHRWRWTLLALLNFAAFFYWEYVFTAFVTTLAGLYAAVLYWRRPLTMLRAWLLVGAGALLAAAVLLLQLAAYMGWDNTREDVRLTLTARNNAADPALLERVTSFYREHGIIFWHNFLDAAPLRTSAAFWESLYQHHLRYYSAPLVQAMALVGLGWLLAHLFARRSVLPRRGAAQASPFLAGLKWLGVVVLLGWLVPRTLPPATAPTLRSPLLWFGAAALGLLLGRVWLGGWWAWARLSWRRFVPLTAFALLAGWLLSPQAGLDDASLQLALDRALGALGWDWPARVIVPAAALFAFALAALGNGLALGPVRATRLARLPVFLFCGLLAYVAAYRIFTGYVYSGYLHRLVPMLVFLTDLLLALVLYAAFGPLRRCARRLAGGGGAAFWSWRVLPGAAALLFITVLLFHWGQLQLGYARAAPPDSYAFLARLEKPPYKGRSLVSNTYPAPMAARTGAWGYADTSIFSGRIMLTSAGFEVERDLKYLWFADAATNPAYLKPDLAITAIQTPNIDVALQLKWERANALPGTLPLAESIGLVQRTGPMQQAFLHHQLAYTDGHHVSIVKLDWDYPPFLRPDLPAFLPTVSGLSLPEKLTLSESAQNLRRRWRVSLSPLAPAGDNAAAIVLNEATIDGRPLFATTTIDRAVTTVVEGGLLRLDFQRGPRSGKVRVEVNDRVEVLDLSAAVAAREVFSFSSANPHGRYTYIPIFAPGLCVQTVLWPESPGGVAEVRYHYAHQEKSPEAATTVRVYREDDPGHWRLADAITFLGPEGVPVRLEEFRRANADATAEFVRIAQGGEKRTYEQWLADHLSHNPGEWSRPGIVPESLPVGRPGTSPVDQLVARRIPLPAGRWQISVSPGTRTKSGPEYFGLPFTMPPPKDRPVTSAPVEFHPPANAAEAPLNFGRLKLRLRFPLNRWPQSEPIVTTGSQEAGDFIYAYYPDAHHIRFGFDHWFKGGPLSPPIAIDFTKEHELEISLGSLFPAAEDVVFASTAAATIRSVKNRVLVILDGRTIIDTAGECYETSPDNVTIGRNDIKGTLCGPLFTGEILARERIWPGPGPAAGKPDSP